MGRIITAQVYIRDACDPDLAGDCAPVIKVEGATELEGLVSEFGISFEEPFQDAEETFQDDLVEAEEIPEPEEEPEMVLDVLPADQPECPLEPDVDWDQSVCGEIERRILSRVLGG